MIDCSFTQLRVYSNQQSKIALLLITCLLYDYITNISSFTITGKNCKHNVSVKYQETVTRTTPTVRRSNELANELEPRAYNNQSSLTKNSSYVVYEPRVRWETKTVCCPGYRTLLLGFCQPICDTPCPPFSYCATPNQCECLAGYEEHHPNDKDQKQLDCRPLCSNGCPRHSQCVARNQCKCRTGYIDTSDWLAPTKCQRIRCAAIDQRYDVAQNTCVKIEISMEDLMKRVAARLTKGLADFALDDEDDEDDEEDRANVQNEILKEMSVKTKN